LILICRTTGDQCFSFPGLKAQDALFGEEIINTPTGSDKDGCNDEKPSRL
jgi:hypothetical protein